MSKRHHWLYLCLIIASLALAYLVTPWVGMIPSVAPFLIAAQVVFGIRRQIMEHLGCSNAAAGSMTVGIVEMLVSKSDTNEASLPAFVTVGKNGRDLRELYQDPGFKTMCAVVRFIGPVPCYPACLALQAHSR